jgi:hypothetical protein
MNSVAAAIGIAPQSVGRLETTGALEKASVATLRRYLETIGYELRIVAVPTSSALPGAGVVELVEPL